MGDGRVENSTKVDLHKFSVDLLGIEEVPTFAGNGRFYGVDDNAKAWAKSRELLKCEPIRKLVTVEVRVDKAGNRKAVPSLFGEVDRKKLTTAFGSCGKTKFSQPPKVTEADRRKSPSLGWAHQVQYYTGPNSHSIVL